MKARSVMSLILRHAIPGAIAVSFLLPLWWVIVASLRPTGLPPSIDIEWWPAHPAWDNYLEIFRIVPLLRQTANAFFVGLVAVPLTIVTASLAGYAMASVSQRLRRHLVIWAVVLMMVPVTALWLTRFLVFKQLGLMNSLGALILPAIGGTNPFYILLFFWTFARIPKETFEAARLDGAGHGRVWAGVAMPLARPTMVTVGVLAFSFYWSDLISPLLYLKSASLYTLPVGLHALQQMDITYGPLMMAAAVVMLMPIVILFLIAHRYFWPDENLLKPVGLRDNKADPGSAGGD